MVLFAVRRADIETFARDLEARGPGPGYRHPAAGTIAGFCKYAVDEELLDHSPAAHVRRPRVDYESCAVALDRNELGALLVTGGLGSPAEHALIFLLALNGLRVSEAASADIEHLGLGHGHRTLTITRKGGKVVTIPMAPRTARRSASQSASEPKGRCSWLEMAGGWTGTVRDGSSARPPAARVSARPRCPHAQACIHHRGAGRRGPAARRPGRRVAC
jgi:integrase